MRIRNTLTSALALSFALGTVSPSFAATSTYRSDLVDPSWNIKNDEIPASRPAGLDKIQTIVVIYGENRSFDNLYGNFPGANGVANALAKNEYKQVDRNGAVLATLPEFWCTSGSPNCLQANPATSPAGPSELTGFTQGQTANLANQPFPIDNPRTFRTPESVLTGDLVHRFYNNQMQIHNGNNDMYTAWADSGGFPMAYYANGAAISQMWPVAQKYVLADNFFQAAFGGSFLNHQYLICACAPFQTNPYVVTYGPYANPALYNASYNAGATSVIVPSALTASGVALQTAASSPASALSGAPAYVNDGRLTPPDANGYQHAINTHYPPYAPSDNQTVPGQGYANWNTKSTLGAIPPAGQPLGQVTIGDILDANSVNWAWYAGAWTYAINNPSTAIDSYGSGNTSPATLIPNFQSHHQPFNFYQKFDPIQNPTYRNAHLLDGGLAGANFIADIDAGKLPPVTFYKPQGNLNEHPGYSDPFDGDAHIATIISHLQKSPQWNNMVVIVTYDENGGFWDHATPPQGDAYGPGTRIPAIIISPFAKSGTVDHSPYDTSSVARLILKRFAGTAANPIYPGALLPGLAVRDSALNANGYRRPADFSNALNLQ